MKKKQSNKISLCRDMAIAAGLLAGIVMLHVIRPESAGTDEVTENGIETVPVRTSEIPAGVDRLSYVQSAFPKISSWDAGQIRPLLATPTKNSLPGKELTEVVETLEHNLGVLESYTLPIQRDIEAWSADSMLVTYEFTASFSKGEADVTLQLLDQDGEFGLLAFNITVIGKGENLS